MIVSCAPFRVSFAGGGSDVAQFYRRRRGAVLSCAIAKYAFVVVHPYFNAAKYHLKYARTELVDRIDQIEHPLLREALRMMKIEPGIEVVSIADIPSGTGLGSSSSFSVALLNALYAHQRIFAPKEQLAREACMLEIEKLAEPIGKQDQYAAAFGGVNFIEGNLMLFFTGSQREAKSVLAHQNKAVEEDAATFGRIEHMVELAYEIRDLLIAGNLDAFGRALDRGWQMKRAVSDKISSAAIDATYERARAAGALGGKIAGAGGGGFLLLYCPKPAQARVREALADLQSLDVRLDWGGARIAFAQ
jgi:D-glycero-alpha-D-manno-heptose-7-phosphate kinase